MHGHTATGNLLRARSTLKGAFRIEKVLKRKVNKLYVN